MTLPVRQKESWSLRFYAWLLELYPPAFLQRHRAEMLQTFADLEDAAPSKTKLWLLIGKDLTMSLILQFFGSRLGRYVISVLVVWIVIFTVGYFRHGSTPGYPLLHVFGGFLPGMLAMYIAMRLYGMPQNRSQIIYVTGILGAVAGFAWILLFLIGYFPGGSTPVVRIPVLQVFGGVLLGMLSMYVAMHFYGMPQNSSRA
jgi:hypothetical protein